MFIYSLSKDIDIFPQWVRFSSYFPAMLYISSLFANVSHYYLSKKLIVALLRTSGFGYKTLYVCARKTFASQGCMLNQTRFLA